jgi:NAD(P)-dependent dehydrogenase (short-subunit alcohol dehydrogenase family)
MKVLIFGASGKIGSEVASQLVPRHEVIKVGSRSGDIVVDYTDGESVKDAFAKISDLDAVVVAVGGDSQFKPYDQLSDDDFRFGAERKLVAQFRIVRLAEQHLNNNGSVTLTSGFLTDYPNPASSATGPFNSAIDTFVRHTSALLGRGIRLNVVSPAPVVEPDRVGTGLVSAAQTAEAYVESIEGNDSGKIYRVWGGLPQVEKC